MKHNKFFNRKSNITSFFFQMAFELKSLKLNVPFQIDFVECWMGYVVWERGKWIKFHPWQIEDNSLFKFNSKKRYIKKMTLYVNDDIRWCPMSNAFCSFFFSLISLFDWITALDNHNKWYNHVDFHFISIQYSYFSIVSWSFFLHLSTNAHLFLCF